MPQATSRRRQLQFKFRRGGRLGARRRHHASPVFAAGVAAYPRRHAAALWLVMITAWVQLSTDVGEFSGIRTFQKLHGSLWRTVADKPRLLYRQKGRQDFYASQTHPAGLEINLDTKGKWAGGPAHDFPFLLMLLNNIKKQSQDLHLKSGVEWGYW